MKIENVWDEKLTYSYILEVREEFIADFCDEVESIDRKAINLRYVLTPSFKASGRYESLIDQKDMVRVEMAVTKAAIVLRAPLAVQILVALRCMLPWWDLGIQW